MNTGFVIALPKEGARPCVRGDEEELSLSGRQSYFKGFEPPETPEADFPELVMSSWTSDLLRAMLFDDVGMAVETAATICSGSMAEGFFLNIYAWRIPMAMTTVESVFDFYREHGTIPVETSSVGSIVTNKDDIEGDIEPERIMRVYGNPIIAEIGLLGGGFDG